MITTSSVITSKPRKIKAAGIAFSKNGGYFLVDMILFLTKKWETK